MAKIPDDELVLMIGASFSSPTFERSRQEVDAQRDGSKVSQCSPSAPTAARFVGRGLTTGSSEAIAAGTRARSARVYGSVMADRPHLATPMQGTQHTTFAGIGVDAVAVGDARVKRVVYPAGLRWSVDVRPLVGGERCQHAHVGFLVQGRFAGEYADGCTFDYVAPRVLAVEPGHDAWIPGDEDAIVVEVDFERATTDRFGLPDGHRH